MKTSPAIDLPYTKASFVQLLQQGARPDSSPFTHKQIAEWCDRFWCLYIDTEATAEVEPLLPILTDVETQWDLYLANTYTLEQLQSGSFEESRLPTDWFEDWLRQVLSSGHRGSDA